MRFLTRDGIIKISTHIRKKFTDHYVNSGIHLKNTSEYEEVVTQEYAELFTLHSGGVIDPKNIKFGRPQFREVCITDDIIRENNYNICKPLNLYTYIACFSRYMSYKEYMDRVEYVDRSDIESKRFIRIKGMTYAQTNRYRYAERKFGGRDEPYMINFSFNIGKVYNYEVDTLLKMGLEI